MADYIIEQGENAYFAHLAGDCDSFCYYCMEEYKEILKRKKKKNVRNAQE